MDDNELTFAIDMPAPKEAQGGIQTLGVEQPTRRGLTLAEVTLNTGHEFLNDLFKKQDNEIFFITTALDLSGTPPFVYPEDPATAGQSWVPLRVGETYKATLGEGIPLFPLREVTGGIAVTIIVGESDLGQQELGKVLVAASEAVKNDDTLLGVVKKLLTDPTSVAIDTVLGALGKVAGSVGTVLKEADNESVGLFRGFFLATGSWEGKLQESQRGATVRLRELGG